MSCKYPGSLLCGHRGAEGALSWWKEEDISAAMDPLKGRGWGGAGYQSAKTLALLSEKA